MISKSERIVITLAGSLCLTVFAAPLVEAACPSVGSVQVAYKDLGVPLPVAPDAYLTVISDECSRTSPPATLVIGKLQLDNRGATPQTVECRLGTDKAWDYGRATVPAAGSATLSLLATNTAGALGGTNLTTFDCRVIEGGNAGNVSASWIKLMTESVDSVLIFGPAP